MGTLIVIGKLAFTSFMIYLLSEIAKRSTTFASLLASLPITAILAGTLLYWETHDTEKVAQFTSGVLWLIYPSLIFYILFPIFLRRGIGYCSALALSVAIMVAFYGIYALVLRGLAIKV